MEKISYDHESDALYIRIKNATVTTDLIAEGVALDYDEAGQIAGIEILDAGKRLDRSRGNSSVLMWAPLQAVGNITLGQHSPIGTQWHSTCKCWMRSDGLKQKNTPWVIGTWGRFMPLENPYNPDRISQAAQSLRELMEKLPRVVRTSDVHTLSAKLPGNETGHICATC